MHIIQAAQKLRPGTAWNLDGGVLSQAIDGTPRVTVPTDAELQAVIGAAAKTPPMPDLQTQINAIWSALGAAKIALPADAVAVQQQVASAQGGAIASSSPT